MTKHKLDQEVEDILQHYGVKGMKWKVTKSKESAGSDEEDSAGGGGGDDDNVFEELSDKLKKGIKAMDKKMNSISKSMKKKGYKILEGIFGKSKTKYSPAKLKIDKQSTATFRKAFKQYQKASPTSRKMMREGKGSVGSTIVRKANRRSTGDKYIGLPNKKKK